MKEDKYYQIILMLLYNGTRISEFLDLKKENVHLEEQYFDVIDSKTENGIRKVPIANKLLPYYKNWYNSCPDCKYLLHTEDGKSFLYRNYYDSYWTPLVEQIGIDRMIISSIDNIPLITALFETASAIGTVGLSLGITSELGIISHLILIFLMFLGRVGGLTLVFAALSERKPNSSKYPQEKITVG